MHATITAVGMQTDGSAVLDLTPLQGNPTSCTSLLLRDAPAGIEAATGTRLWLGCGIVMIGETVWAEFVAADTIRLVPPDHAATWSWQDVLGPVRTGAAPHQRRLSPQAHRRLVAELLARPHRRRHPD